MTIKTTKDKPKASSLLHQPYSFFVMRKTCEADAQKLAIDSQLSIKTEKKM